MPEKRTGGALRHRNFKLFFFGQSISVMGNWMTRLATTWLVYRLTHSALLLGVVGFSGQIVSFLAGPFAGVCANRNISTWLMRNCTVSATPAPPPR